MSRRARTTRTRLTATRLLTAGALVASGSAAAVASTGATGTDDGGDVQIRTISVRPADRVEPVTSAEDEVADLLVAAVDAREALDVAEPEPEPEPEPAPEAAPANAGVWDRLAQCEAGGNWSINTGNGYYGGLQFKLSSWEAVGGTGMPHEASRETQIQMGERLLDKQGWGAWPSCSRQLGLR